MFAIVRDDRALRSKLRESQGSEAVSHRGSGCEEAVEAMEAMEAAMEAVTAVDAVEAVDVTEPMDAVAAMRQ
jgi:hypothetical protein